MQFDLGPSTAGNTNVALVAKGDSNHAHMATASGERRAPKSGRDSGGHEPVANVVEGAYSFMGEASQCNSVLSTVDKNVWYADNGATDHNYDI